METLQSSSESTSVECRLMPCLEAVWRKWLAYKRSLQVEFANAKDVPLDRLRVCKNGSR